MFNDRMKVFFVATYMVGLMAIGMLIGIASSAIYHHIGSKTEYRTETVAEQTVAVTDNEEALEELMRKIELELH